MFGFLYSLSEFSVNSQSHLIHCLRITIGETKLRVSIDCCSPILFLRLPLVFKGDLLFSGENALIFA